VREAEDWIEYGKSAIKIEARFSKRSDLEMKWES
jgi:hypothetical protein